MTRHRTWRRAVVLAVTVLGTLAAAPGGPLPTEVAPAAVTAPVLPPDPGYSLTNLPAQTFGCGAGCVDARRHGVVGDGITDDAPALQRLLDGALTAKTPVIYLPAGTYLLSSTLYVPGGVTVRGAGIDPASATVLLADWSRRARITKVLRPQDPTATRPVTIRDLTVDGGRRAEVCATGTNDPDLCPADHHGGISAGNHWTVTRVRFVGINGFKMWVAGVSNVEVSWCRFDDLVPGATSGTMDNIGGGAAATRVVLRDNEFDASVAGNAIDLTRAAHVTVTRNRVWGRPGDPHNLYLEGVTDSTVSDNVLRDGSGITLQSNGNYESSVSYGVINPRKVTVTRNLIVDSTWAGVQVLYRGLVERGRIYAESVTPARVPPFVRAGGANTITANTVVRSAKAGVILSGSDDRHKTAPDTLVGNVVVDAGQDGRPGFNDGLGETELGGIIDAIGANDVIRRNTVINQGAVGVRYGVVLGRKMNAAGAVRTRSTNTTVTDTTVSGLPGAAVRRTVPLVDKVLTGPVPTTGGAVVTVLGSGFLRPDRLDVVMGGTRLRPIVVSDTRLTFLTPALPAGAHPVEVVGALGGSAAVVVGLDGTAGNLSQPAAVRALVPVAPLIDPDTVVPGATGITLRVATDQPLGNAADYAAHPVKATLSTVLAPRPRTVATRFVDAGHLDVVLPAGPVGPATLQFTRDGVSGPAASLTYGASLSAIGPVAGPAAGGTAVVLRGVGLTGAAAFTFGTTPAMCTVVSDREVRCTSPEGSVGTASVGFSPRAGVTMAPGPVVWTWR